MLMQTPRNDGASSSNLIRQGARLGVGVKLASLILAVVAAFLLVNYFSYNSLREAESEMSVARKLVLASNDLNRFAVLSRTHLRLSDMSPENAEAAIAESQDSVRQQRDILNSVMPALQYANEGLRPLEELRGSADVMEGLINDSLQPAVASGNQAGIEAAVSGIDQLHDQQEQNLTDITASIQESITDWENRHDQTLSRVGWLQLLTSLAAAAFAFGVSFFIYRVQRRRLFKLNHAVDELANGKLSTRVAVCGNDEISDVGHSVNRMAAVLESNTDDLRHQRNRMRSIHQGISDGIIVYDKNGLILSANPAAEMAIGKLEKEIAGARATGIGELDRVASLPEIVPRENMVKCWQEKACTHPDCPSFGSNDLRCWQQCGTHCYNEIQGTFMQKRDACERCNIYMQNGTRNLDIDHGDSSYKATISPLLDDQGSEAGRVAVLRDITELKTAESLLRLQNSELLVLNDIAAMLFSNMEDLESVIDDALKQVVAAVGAKAGIIATVDPGDTNIKVRSHTGINRHVAAFLGLMPAAIIRDLESEKETGLYEAAKAPRRWKAVGSILRRDGLANTLIYPFGAAGKVEGVLIVADDVKTQYSDEDLSLLRAAALQIGVAIQNTDLFNNVEKAKKTWETTFDSMGDGVFVLDLDHRIVMTNKAMAGMIDSIPERIIGKRCFEVAHGTDCPIDACPFDDVVEKGEGRSIEIDEPSLGGNYNISINPIKNAHGEVVGVVHVISDVTEKNRLKEQLLQSEKMAAVGQLVSGVAHELNNPLTGVMGYSQLLLRRLGEDSEASRDLHAIVDETERATKIVQNLLSFARKHQPTFTVVNLNQVIRNVLQLRNYELEVKNISIDLRLAEELPETMADFHQLEQVLLNVINNAVQAVEAAEHPGRIVISTDHDETYIRVSIDDNGPGISAEAQKRIFDPFFTTKGVGEGTGLGLSICYGIIEEHGGRMEVSSHMGKGTTVSFTLPIAKAGGEALQKNGEKRAAAGSRNVLLVDDEQAVVDLLSDILTLDGHAVEVAGNCSEALAKLSQASFDSVITDIGPSCIEGRDLYRRIREIDPELAANVIFIADTDDGEVVREYLEETGNKYLMKPFNLHDLRHNLQEVMKSHGY